jgi:hypothetical protein
VLVALQKPTGKDGRLFAGGESTGKDGFFAGAMSPVEELKELKRVALNESFAGSKCLHFLLRCALPATDGTRRGRWWTLVQPIKI